MPKKNRRRMNRVRNLITITALTGVIISVSTFAWFVGMRTVNVSSFDVEIAATESLILSLDGKRWDTTVNISEATLDEVSYEGHTNSWGKKGLIPMSSVGEMDSSVSRMKLYEKASFTPTPGGYRVMASRVNNYQNDNPEQDGYVAFDLFIKNFSGTQYITALNIKDEEAIYLTTDSEVTVAADGVANTGIENSVRVAFGQIGRVIGTETDPAKITGITCNPDELGIPEYKNDVTGICRTAQIWEPNDTKHTANAIRWYQTSCLPRKTTGTDVSEPSSYTPGENCNAVVDGTAYPTYAVSDEIGSGDNVDNYDGAEYNTYTNTTLLQAYPYFTDTHKMQKGVERPAFMTLAPNSITKVRIYIYIEGQDIDNYDFASIGKRISVKFGFTKERFTEEDVNYEGPSTMPGTDTIKPVITLNGEETVTIALGSQYNDAGATASDVTFVENPEDPEGPLIEKTIDLTTKIRTINPVNTSVAGTYYVTYDVNDFALNYAERVIRTVIVE